MGKVGARLHYAPADGRWENLVTGEAVPTAVPPKMFVVLAVGAAIAVAVPHGSLLGRLHERVRRGVVDR